MKRVLVNEPVCMGCHLCEVYCRLQHSPGKDILKLNSKDRRSVMPRLRVESKKPVYFPLRCQHCAEPSCVYACLTGVLSRNPETGIVIADEEKCIGCWTCILACSYGAIRQDTLRHKSVKCDLCNSADMPACVVNCPNQALIYEEVADEEPVKVQGS